MTEPENWLAALIPEAIRELSAYHVPKPDGITIKLDANEHPFALSAELAASLSRALADVALHRYPDPSAAALRARIASRVGVSGDELILGNGSDELIGLVVAALSAPRAGAARARIVYPVPTFSVYRIAALAASVEPVEVALGPRFVLDVEALAASLAGDPRPNLVFLARPNNPTGTLWDRDPILSLIAACPDIVFVVDEAYEAYAGDSLLAETRGLDNVVILRTLSKIGLAALRVGFAIAPPALCAQLEKLRMPYNLGSLNQCAAHWALGDPWPALVGRCAEVVAERDALLDAIGQIPGLDAFASRANLVLFRVTDPRPGAATELWRALAGDGIAVRNLDQPGALSGCLRVTVGTAAENAAFIAALRRARS